MRRWSTGLCLVLGVALLAPAQVWAQDAPTTTAEAAPGEAIPEAARKKFEKAERLEALRYRNLWIAYGCFWLVVFVFVFRTWRTSRGTEAELEDLKTRLKLLEEGRGAGEEQLHRG